MTEQPGIPLTEWVKEQEVSGREDPLFYCNLCDGEIERLFSHKHWPGFTATDSCDNSPGSQTERDIEPIVHWVGSDGSKYAITWKSGMYCYLSASLTAERSGVNFDDLLEYSRKYEVWITHNKNPPFPPELRYAANATGQRRFTVTLKNSHQLYAFLRLCHLPTSSSR